MLRFSFHALADSKARSDGFPEASYHHFLNSESANEWNCQEPSPSEFKLNHFNNLGLIWYPIPALGSPVYDFQPQVWQSDMTCFAGPWQRRQQQQRRQRLWRGCQKIMDFDQTARRCRKEFTSSKQHLPFWFTRKWLSFPAMSRDLRQFPRGPQDNTEIDLIFPSSPTGAYSTQMSILTVNWQLMDLRGFRFPGRSIIWRLWRFESVQ